MFNDLYTGLEQNTWNSDETNFSKNSRLVIFVQHYIITSYIKGT